MAATAHLAILQQGVDSWNRWREQAHGVVPDLREAQLGGADLLWANLRGAQLGAANLTRANLAEADLAGANLTHATLARAQLQRARLGEAHLGGADLSQAILGGASLVAATLVEANLSGATLRGADLRQADLRWANLAGTDLSGARLDGANLGRAVLLHTLFADVDLSQVRGLREAQHRGPSTVGIDTLYRSQGRVPPDFLRGCGVPDRFIEYLASLTTPTIAFSSCFISYSHTDDTFARRLHQDLQTRGVRCWLAGEDMRLGRPMVQEIERGIRLTDRFLLCCSRAALASSWVDYEVGLALQRELELRAQGDQESWRLIPLDLDGHLFGPHYSGRALRIRSRLAASFVGWERNEAIYAAALERLVATLTAGRPSEVASAATDLRPD